MLIGYTMQFRVFGFNLIIAKLTSQTTILCMSAADLERTTKLSSFDVSVLLKAVAYSLPCPTMRTALLLYNNVTHNQSSNKEHRLSLGCQILDGFLRGGILREGITEITGESSSGKTQICLQLCLSVQLPPEHGGFEGGKYMYLVHVTLFLLSTISNSLCIFSRLQFLYLCHLIIFDFLFDNPRTVQNVFKRIRC